MTTVDLTNNNGGSTEESTDSTDGLLGTVLAWAAVDGCPRCWIAGEGSAAVVVGCAKEVTCRRRSGLTTFSDWEPNVVLLLA